MASELQSASINLGSPASTVAQAFTTQNCTVGSTLWCVAYWNSATATCTVADSVNGAWTPVGTPLTGVGILSSFRSQMFMFVGNISAGKPTVTATVSTANGLGLAIGEYSGGSLETSAYLNVNGSPIVGAAATPANTGDFAVAYIITGNSASSVASPYTLRELANFGDNGTADNMAPTIGVSTGPTWTISTTTDNMTGIVIITPGAQTVSTALRRISNPFVSSRALRQKLKRGWTRRGGNSNPTAPGATDAIIPAQITAGSTISGAIVVGRGIVGGSITAGSTMSGALVATRAIKPANITAGSTMSGNIGRLRPITPGSITAGSTLSGKVAAARAIKPAQITAGTTISGSIGRGRPIVPGTITAGTTLSGVIGLKRVIVPGTITAGTTLSGSIFKTSIKNISPGTITAGSTLSGTTISLRAVKPAQITAGTTLSGNTKALRAVKPATINMGATLSGSVHARRAISTGTINASISFSGVVTKKILIRPGNINSGMTFTFTGTLSSKLPGYCMIEIVDASYCSIDILSSNAELDILSPTATLETF